MPQKFVAYQRVSTDKQGRSGLGREAQEAAVAGYAQARGGDIVDRFVEVESGKRNDRPELGKALALCRKQKATLIIAKLDRLARNVAFIANLMESGVDFIAVDMPSATRLTIHILAAVAEHEREMISARTKAALQARKARGGRLGAPDPAIGSAVGVARSRRGPQPMLTTLCRLSTVCGHPVLKRSPASPLRSTHEESNRRAVAPGIRLLSLGSSVAPSDRRKPRNPPHQYNLDLGNFAALKRG